MMLWKSCDYCGEGNGNAVRFDGGGYCSIHCASCAEMAKRKQGCELRTRQELARRTQREREADKLGGMLIAATLACMALILVFGSGCDAPGDHIGPDERAHMARGHRIGGIE